jgi:CIC family chloride channel protein
VRDHAADRSAGVGQRWTRLRAARERLAGLTRPAAQPNARGNSWSFGRTPGFWLILLPTAVLAGLAGAALKLLLRSVEHLTWFYRAGDLSTAVAATSPLHRVAALAVAGVLAGGGWWLLERIAGTRGGEMTDAVWSGEGRMKTVPTLLSAALTMTTIGMGASLGREQPPKEAAAGIASWIAGRAGLAAEERCLLLACAAGGGWAAVYNIPLAGGVFAAEVLVGSLALSTAVPALAASAVATAVAGTVISLHPYYAGIPNYPASASIIVWSALAGPVLGLAGMTFVWLLGVVRGRRLRGGALLAGPPLVFAAVGLLAIAFPLLPGNGRDMSEHLFRSELGPLLVFALVVLKPIATAASWGSGASGGMFTPTTSYGAAAGALLGRLWSVGWPGIPGGGYALVGAAAVLAAAMSAPVSAVLLTVELTGGTASSLLLPVLLAVGGASMTASWLGGGSIYSVRLPQGRRGTDGHGRAPESSANHGGSS